MPTTNDVYRRVLTDFTYLGDPDKEQVLSRDGECIEKLGYHTQWSLDDPAVTLASRKLNYGFMFAEAAWILSGSDWAEDIVPYCKAYKKYSDDGITFFGAYGPPYKAQLDRAVETLSNDPRSRRALITLWRQNPPDSLNIPCTISLQWIIRKEHLHCFVSMRSSDVFMGLPYDVFCFSMMTWLFWQKLRKNNDSLFQLLRPGILHVAAASQHLYSRDFDKARAVVASNSLDVVDLKQLRRLSPWYENLTSYLRTCANELNPSRD